MYQTEGTELGGQGGSRTGLSSEDLDFDCMIKEVLNLTSVGSTLGGIL